MIERADGRMTVPQIFIGATACRRLRRPATRSSDAGKLDPLLAAARTDRMTARSTSTFRVGLIQMRSGRTPARQSRRRRALIGEAKAAGADYVQTPEMTNIMEVKRERLFAAIVAEESDTCLAAFRELARKLGIYLHIGSLAIKVSPDKAANRSFLIDPKGEIAARYDKIHMFDVDLAGGESYRELRSYRPGELAVLSRSAVGPARPDHLLRPALSRALSRAGRGRRLVPGDPVRLHPADRRGALARADARPRHRERLLRVRRRARRQARERPRDLRPFARSSTRGAASSPKAAPSRA